MEVHGAWSLYRVDTLHVGRNLITPCNCIKVKHREVHFRGDANFLLKET